MKSVNLLVISMLLSSLGYSQSQSFKAAFEFGFMGGGAYYIGDLNQKKTFRLYQTCWWIDC